ncbi:MAG: TonB-dependent siderophore receptor [Nostoc sp.]|uniref:TonB-dependent siderophore receptor n=1 Tax=Nostoc sp. TaxID=1180 RepID=UPI002FF8A10D
MWNLQLPLLAATLVSVFFARIVVAQEISRSQNLAKNQENRSLHEIKLPITNANKKIRQLSELEPVLTSARMLLVQSPTPASEIVQVTAVKANPTNKGVEVILQTSKGQQLQLVNRSSGNNFITDIPNAQLRLASGDAFTFRSDKPIAGVSQITVTNFDANTIRVTVTGQLSQPVVELFDSPDEGIIFSVASALSATPSQQQLQTQSPQTSQPPSQTQPTQPSASGDEPIELVVTGEQDNYRATDGSTATRTDTPLRDIPQSIQVIPQQVLRDQQATTIQDALRNVSGANITSSPGFQTNQFALRGFLSGPGNYLRDGLFDAQGAQSVDLANIERVEILKGPASVLFGLGTPGATINLITKKPLRDPFFEVNTTVGNYSNYRGAIDLSGPLNESKTVLYRLNAFYQSDGSFVDFLNTKSYSIAPVVSLMIGKRTKLTLDAQYTDSRVDGFSLGLPALGTVLPNPNGKIPINRSTGEPNYYRQFRIGSLAYNLDHQFSDDWSLRNAFRFSYVSSDGLRYVGTELLADNRSLDRFLLSETFDDYSYNLTTNLIGKFSTGSVKHQLLFGVDLSRSEVPLNVSDFGEAAPFDIYKPVYGLPPLIPVPNNDPNNLLSNTSLTDQLGVYIQDQVNIAENLKLLLGGRFDLFTQTNADVLAHTSQSQGGDVFSPRAGIVYQPSKTISLYGSYSRSFTPNSGRSFDNSLFDPERGRQYEVGVKADLSQSLSATLAYYDLVRSNVLTDDPNHPNYSIQTGEQRSRGIELNISGQILPGWNIYAGYAYTDARITRDNTYRPGNLLYSTPENAVNLWTTYEFQRGGLKGFGVGLGLFYVGEREGDLQNSFQVPSYFRTDAALFYKGGQFGAQLNFRNLFNIDYFETVADISRVYPGSPLMVEGRISWEF